jgi:two-component system sensor histidine kinase UhpB
MATGRVLAAQEAERLRIAQELHDQVGQELTAVLLGLSRVQSRAGDELQVPILAVQDAVRASLELGSEVELVIYRVAQEALTNVARHSGAREAEMSICHEGGALRLRVRDRGRGLPTMQTPETGMRGMRERALLIDAELEISNVTPTGCEVGLDVPLERLR